MRLQADVSDLPLISAYNLEPPPMFVVRDPSSEAVEFLNVVSCYIGQLRGAPDENNTNSLQQSLTKNVLYRMILGGDVGLNYERDENDNLANTNPGRQPYIAMVDPSLCGEEGDKFFWSVYASGPSSGAGEYKTQFIFNLDQMTINGEMTNTMGNCDPDCDLLSSRLSYSGMGGAMRGGIVFDYTDPDLSKVQFVEEVSEDFMDDDPYYGGEPYVMKGLQSLRLKHDRTHKSARGWNSMKVLT